MVVIINGRPGVGKDEFVRQCGMVMPCRIFNVSTIDFVKYIARKCGWTGEKTLEHRKFLSDLKELLSEWNDVPFKKTVETIQETILSMSENGHRDNDYVIFVHCREPKNIIKLKERFPDAMTLLIRRPLVEETATSNSSDEEVFQFQYDAVIVNDGSVDDLRHQADFFLRAIRNID